MKKRTTILCVLCACAFLSGCARRPIAESEKETTAGADAETEQILETETETEKEIETETEEISIPVERRIDFTAFDETLLASAFPTAAETDVSLCADGVQFTASALTVDPQVRFDIDSFYGAIGYEKTENGGFVPFIPETVGAIVVKLKATERGRFEFFYATGEIQEAEAGCSVVGTYMKSDSWQYLLLDLGDADSGKYNTCFNDGCRIDWSASACAGDTVVLGEMLFWEDTKEAEEYVKMMNAEALMEGTGYGTAECTGSVEAGYYVCLYQNKLGTEDAGVREFFDADNLEAAMALCNSEKQYGYRIADENGTVVYAPYTLLQCDILREAKYVTDYARENGFTYGDAPINPAIDHGAKKVSCDRLVCWVLYRAGFTDQPYTQGVVVSAMHTWSEENGFMEITDKEALEPGDIVLVRPNSSGTYALHTFLYAGETDREGVFYRYDHGSDARIQSVQPNMQALELDGAPFWRAYRPVATAENNICYARYYANTIES